MKYLRLMRVKHYIKNLLIYSALLCSGQIMDPDKLKSSTIGFIAFCFLASATYIINDLKDIERDRNHPKKKFRPLASGEVSKKEAIILIFILLSACMVLNLYFHSRFVYVLILMYLLVNVCYSFGLKNYPVIDMFILTFGYIIRMIYGALITQIEISSWMYLTVFSASFYLVLGKRRNEYRDMNSDETRKSLKFYNYQFLNMYMYVCLTMTNVFYALWTLDSMTAVHYKNEYLLFSFPIFFMIFMKYDFDIEGDSDGDPVDVLLGDKSLIIMCFIYAAMMLGILYFS